MTFHSPPSRTPTPFPSSAQKIHDITQWANQKWERNGAEKCWNGNGSPMLQQEKKGQWRKYIFMKTRLCPRVFLIHNWIRVSRVKTENGRGCDDILYNPDDMEKVFFSTSCLAYSSIKRTYRPGKEASRFLSPVPSSLLFPLPFFSRNGRLKIIFHFINYS
jgi:hypothetical protein